MLKVTDRHRDAYLLNTSLARGGDGANVQPIVLRHVTTLSGEAAAVVCTMVIVVVSMGTMVVVVVVTVVVTMVVTMVGGGVMTSVGLVVVAGVEGEGVHQGFAVPQLGEEWEAGSVCKNKRIV